MGMKPAQMRDLLNRVDWDEALRGTPSYEQSLLRRKQDRREYPGLQLGWNKGPRLGAGLNGGHFVRLILDRVALPYWQVRDFDDRQQNRRVEIVVSGESIQAGITDMPVNSSGR